MSAIPHRALPVQSALSLAQLATSNAISRNDNFQPTMALTGIPALVRLVLNAYRANSLNELPPLFAFVLAKVPINPSLASLELNSLFELEKDWQTGEGTSRNNGLRLWTSLGSDKLRLDQIQLVNGLIAPRLLQLFRFYGTRLGTRQVVVTYANGTVQLLRAVYVLHKVHSGLVEKDSQALIVWSVLIIHCLLQLQARTLRGAFGLTPHEIEKLHLQIPDDSEYRAAILYLQRLASSSHSPGRQQFVRRVVASIQMEAPSMMADLGIDAEGFSRSVDLSLCIASSLLSPLLTPSDARDVDVLRPRSYQPPTRAPRATAGFAVSARRRAGL